MKKQPLKNMSTSKSPSAFFTLALALSLPISLIGAVIGLELLPGHPVSSLVVTFCPLIAALILVYRELGHGLFDMQEPNQNVAVVYPKMLELIDR